MKKFLAFILCMSMIHNALYADLSSSLNSLRNKLEELKGNFVPGLEKKGPQVHGAAVITALSDEEMDRILEITTIWGYTLTPEVKDLLQQIFGEFKYIRDQFKNLISDINYFKEHISKTTHSDDLMLIEKDFLRNNIAEQEKLIGLLQQLKGLPDTIDVTKQDKWAVRDLINGFDQFLNQLNKHFKATQEAKELQGFFKDDKNENIAAKFLNRITRINNNADIKFRKLMDEIKTAWEIK